MIKTYYFCDRCNKEMKNADELTSVAIRIRSCSDFLSAQWCRDCMVEVGIWKDTPKPNAPPLPEPLTLEQMIREIAYEAAREVVNHG